MTFSLFVSPLLVVIRAALLSRFLLVPVVLVMPIFLFVAVIVMMVAALLVTALLAEVVVMFARLVVPILLLAALLVARLLVEVTFSFIKAVDLRFEVLLSMKSEKENQSLTLHLRLRRRTSFLSWTRLICESRVFPWWSGPSWTSRAPPTYCLSLPWLPSYARHDNHLMFKMCHQHERCSCI